jgi:hypothetical protein
MAEKLIFGAIKLCTDTFWERPHYAIHLPFGFFNNRIVATNQGTTFCFAIK